MKILLVDDQPIANLILRKLIETRRPEAQIMEFTDARQALESINDFDPYLIFLDINMPHMNGWEFLEEMAVRDYPHKVAILTSSTSSLDSKRSQEYENVVDFFVKPLGIDSLHHFLDSIEVVS